MELVAKGLQDSVSGTYIHWCSGYHSNLGSFFSNRCLGTAQFVYFLNKRTAVM